MSTAVVKSHGWPGLVRALLVMLCAAPGLAYAQRTAPGALRAIRALESAADAAGATVRSPVTGLATFIAPGRGRPLPIRASASASPEERGRLFLRDYGEAFGISDQQQVEMARAGDRDEAGIEQVRFRQRHHGVKVRGGEVIIHLRQAAVTAVTAKTLPDLDGLDTRPRVTPQEALATAQAVLVKHRKIADAALGVPQLEIFNRGLFTGGSSPTRLAWFIEATGRDLREVIWIDAQRGSVLLHFNQIADTKVRTVYDSGHGSTLPGTLVRGEGGSPTGDVDADSAYAFAGDTYDYFLSQHGRDSYDGAGAQVQSSVHYCPSAAQCPYANAFWNGSRIVYGEGFAAADDVDAHELTHAVTERSAGLAYFMRSGALNESFSDIFGETVDLTNNRGTDTPAVRWLIGEDIPGRGAFRNMMNPGAFGHPGKVSEATCTSGGSDNGGVHTNSAVPNHAYALMVDGGTYNGRTIVGIGLTKAARVQYRALTQYLVSTADFHDYYSAVQQACVDLVGTAGITAADCSQITLALDAVEMNSDACSPPAVPALCPAGQTPTTLFFDDLENITSGNWANPATGVNHWDRCSGTPDIYCTDYAISGSYSFGGGGPEGIGDSSVAMTLDVLIPSGDARMQCYHAYSFESAGTNYYDGGVLEYSTDGGATWQDAGPLIAAGAGYGGVIISDPPAAPLNPLGGRSGFVGSSAGYTASQLDLRSLAGQRVRLRFRMGTDPYVTDLGWIIDDVRIYSCAATAAGPDFVVTDSVLTPPDPVAGGTFSATVTVKNQGSAAGPPGTLQAWGDQAGMQACGALGDRSATLENLAAGERRTVLIADLPAGAAGDKTLRAFIDSACQAAETQETNNQSTTTYRVAASPYVIAAVANPTLGGSVSCNPESTSHGDTSVCKATPSAGYAFAGWGGDCAGQAGKTCTLANVTSNKTVTATFIDINLLLPGRGGWRVILGP